MAANIVGQSLREWVRRPLRRALRLSHL